jgi:peroxiredoxin
VSEPNLTSLADQLAAIAAQVRSAAPTIAEETDRLVTRLRQSGAGLEAIGPGDSLPSFALPRDDGRLVFSADLLAKGPLVLSLNRGHWCPFCEAELGALEGIRPQVEALGGTIVAALPEGPAFLRKVRDRGVGFDLLVDVDCAYALELSLAIWVGDPLFEIFSAAGIFGIRNLNAGFLPIPATLVVAPDGRIAEAWTDPDFRLRLEPEKILVALRRLRGEGPTKGDAAPMARAQAAGAVEGEAGAA